MSVLATLTGRIRDIFAEPVIGGWGFPEDESYASTSRRLSLDPIGK